LGGRTVWGDENPAGHAQALPRNARGRPGPRRAAGHRPDRAGSRLPCGVRPAPAAHHQGNLPASPDGVARQGCLTAVARDAPAPPSGRPVRVVRIIARLNIGGPAWHVVLLSAGTQARYPTLLVAGSVQPGEADMSGLARYLRLPAERVGVIPLGLDLDRFLTADADLERRRFREDIGARSDVVVTMVGRLTAIKNHELALRAFARLPHESPRFLLVLVGGGEEEGRLRRLASHLGLAERVRFLGWRRDLEAVYYGSDIVALTSDNEGTPVCLIEALACGRAVVATNVGGVADVLEEGRLGLLVPPRDESALARALLTLADGSARERLGMTG